MGKVHIKTNLRKVNALILLILLLLALKADSEDNAKAFKDELKADGSNFAELAAKYATDDFNKKAYTEEGFTTQLGVTKAVLQSQRVAIATADPHEHEEGVIT